MKQFFVDDVGALSCMRLMLVILVVAILATWVAANIVAMCSGAPYASLGHAEAGVIGVAFGCKAGQGRFEYGGPPPARHDRPEPGARHTLLEEAGE